MRLRTMALALLSGGCVVAGLWLGSKLNVPASRVRVIGQSSHLERLRAAGELTTVVSSHETTITPSMNTEVFGIKTGETVLSYRAVGQVRVGVDLSKLSAESIQQSKSGVTVFVPAPTVFSVALLHWTDCCNGASGGVCGQAGGGVFERRG